MNKILKNYKNIKYPLCGKNEPFTRYTYILQHNRLYDEKYNTLCGESRTENLHIRYMCDKENLRKFEIC